MGDVDVIPQGEFSSKSRREAKHHDNPVNAPVDEPAQQAEMKEREKENVPGATEVSNVEETPPAQGKPELVNGVVDHHEEEKERDCEEGAEEEQQQESEPKPDHPSFKIVSVVDSHELEYETGLLDDVMDDEDEDEDEVISFEVPSTMAKPVAITEVLPVSPQGDQGWSE